MGNSDIAQAKRKKHIYTGPCECYKCQNVEYYTDTVEEDDRDEDPDRDGYDDE